VIPYVNRVTILGDVDNEPEMKAFDRSTMLRFKVKTMEVWEANGEQKSRCEWHSVVLWGKSADLARDVRKGDRVYVEGRIQTRSYEADGGKKYVTEINATMAALIGAEQGAGQVQDGGREAAPRQPVSDDDVPF